VVRNAGIYDYVIVGAGTAGCLLANRLGGPERFCAASGGREGRLDLIHIPVGYLIASTIRAPTGA
jgi:choline dehydrogenase